MLTLFGVAILNNKDKGDNHTSFSDDCFIIIIIYAWSIYLTI